MLCWRVHSTHESYIDEEKHNECSEKEIETRDEEEEKDADCRK